MTNDSMSRKPFSIPVHTHQVCGKPVRYFAPVNGSLDFPFVSLDDLLNAMPIPDDQKRIVADKLAVGEYADAVRGHKYPWRSGHDCSSLHIQWPYSRLYRKWAYLSEVRCSDNDRIILSL